MISGLVRLELDNRTSCRGRSNGSRLSSFIRRQLSAFCMVPEARSQGPLWRKALCRFRGCPQPVPGPCRAASNLAPPCTLWYLCSGK